MKKTLSLLLLSLALVSCSGTKSSSSNNSNSSSLDSSSISSSSDTSSSIIKTYEYDEDMFINTADEYNFKTTDEYIFPLKNKGSDKLTYTLSDDKTFYIVSNANRTLSDNNLVIPSTYNDLPVKEIEAEAFVELAWLESVYIPSSICKIGDGAFSMSALKKVYYDAVEVNDFNARNWVFYPSNNNSGIDVYFGPHVKRIPNRLFFPLSTEPDKNPLVKSIVFDKDCALDEIGDYAFYKSNLLKEIYLPNSVTKIGDYAFYQSSIEELVLPTSLTSIGKYAFSFSKNKGIKFNENLAYVGDYAFYGNSELVGLDLSKTKLKTISKFAFSHLDKITYLNLPNSLKEIFEEGFSYLISLKKLDLASYKFILHEGAFKDLHSLTHLRLGEIEVIGTDAFANLKSIEELCLSGSISNLSINSSFFKNMSTLNLRIFIKGIESLPSFLFYVSNVVNDSLTVKELVLDNSLKNINDYAFYNLYVSSISYLGLESTFTSININNNEQLNNASISYFEGGLK